MILQIIDILSTMKKQAEATVQGQRLKNEADLKALTEIETCKLKRGELT